FDIGGANGYQAQSLIKAGFDVVLVEPGEQAIQNAQRRGLKELICATLDDAKFYPNTMPAIGLFDVVEHIADETGFLQTVQNILQPGGRLYLTVPVYQWLWSDEDVRAGHFRRYTIKSLSQALRRAGLEMEYCSYFFSILPLPIYFTRTVPSYFRMAKTITTTKTSPSSTTQHRQRPGMVGRLAEMFFRSEHKRIAQGRHIPFGSSCLAVAKKVSVGV
ncbi:MAG: methyltransferase type 12, partial [uncultured bacterium]